MRFQGERTLPLFAPFNAFPRLLTPHRLAGKDCQSGVGRFLKVLGGANLSSIRRTENQKPAELQRVLCVNIGPERILKPLLVFRIKATAMIFGLLSFLLGYIMKVTGSTYHTSTGLPL